MGFYRDRPEVKGWEEVHVIKTSQHSTVKIAVVMQHAKQKEAQDPINHNNSDDASMPFNHSDASSPQDVSAEEISENPSKG